MPSTIYDMWLSTFRRALEDWQVAEALKLAAAAGNLGDWTRLLTGVVVRSCESLGWRGAGRGHPLDVLPKAGQEYLGIDVMAFPGDEPGASARRWPLPIAVFELENAKGREAYSLWKVICVRAAMRVVFAYRDDWTQTRDLLGSLKAEVLDGFDTHERSVVGDQTLVVTGSRGEGGTFPNGFFKVWRVNPNIGDFEKVSGWG